MHEAALGEQLQVVGWEMQMLQCLGVGPTWSITPPLGSPLQGGCAGTAQRTL